jgi:hypothetical protein
MEPMITLKLRHVEFHASIEFCSVLNWGDIVMEHSTTLLVEDVTAVLVNLNVGAVVWSYLILTQNVFAASNVYHDVSSCTWHVIRAEVGWIRSTTKPLLSRVHSPHSSVLSCLRPLYIDGLFKHLYKLYRVYSK